jgi:cytosine/adenosine deaminase-related metal-dependent hydrolase
VDSAKSAGLSSVLIRHAAVVYPCVARNETPIVDGWLRIEGRRIGALGAEPCPDPVADVEVDGRGKLLIPGLVNVHHHFWQSLTRAVPLGRSERSIGWLRAMYPLWQELDADAMSAGARLAAAELLLTGATTSVDFAYLYPGGRDDLVDVDVAEAHALGLRLHVVRGCTPVLEADIAAALADVPGIDAIRLTESRAEIVAACERAFGRHHDPSRLAMCRVAVGPTAIPFDDAELLTALIRISAAAGGGRHAHLQPRPDEVHRCEMLHGCRPTEYLRRVGWLGPGSWLAHGTMHAEDDIRVLAQTGTGVAHCMSQNMRLGYPAGPIPAMLAAGVSVGIGVDGAASNDGGSMVAELRLVHLVHRLAGVQPGYSPERWLTPHDVLWMATRHGADILGRDDIGRLAPGCAADAVLVDLRQVGYAGGLHDPLGTLVMAGDCTVVDTTIVNGVIVVRDGRLTRASQARIVDDANRTSAAMVRRAAARTGMTFGSIAPQLAGLVGE